MNPIVRKFLKVTAIAVTLLITAAVMGIAYTWYVGEYGEEPVQTSQPLTGTGGMQSTARPKLPDDAALGAVVQTITSPVTPGSNASIMIKTNPEANCTISVTYNNVPSKDSGLTPKVADEYGLAEWTWTVEPGAPLGNWPIKVTCANKKNTAVVQNDLRVVRSLD